MTRDEAIWLRAGDLVLIDPTWNRTETHRKIAPGGTLILGVKTAQSQTGVLFEVETVRGERVALDAGWFDLPPPATPTLI